MFKWHVTIQGPKNSPYAVCIRDNDLLFFTSQLLHISSLLCDLPISTFLYNLSEKGKYEKKKGQKSRKLTIEQIISSRAAHLLSS